jgi:transcriptional regulator with XRE-family HTH domain
MNGTPSSLREIVGRRIRDVRRQRGMSAAALAKALGWPTETLINFEYGRRPLYLDRLEVIAQALNVSPLALLVADADTADTVALLATDAELAGEVRFFLSALSAEPQPLGDENDTSSPPLR